MNTIPDGQTMSLTQLITDPITGKEEYFTVYQNMAYGNIMRCREMNVNLIDEMSKQLKEYVSEHQDEIYYSSIKKYAKEHEQIEEIEVDGNQYAPYKFEKSVYLFFYKHTEAHSKDPVVKYEICANQRMLDIVIKSTRMGTVTKSLEYSNYSYSSTYGIWKFECGDGHTFRVPMVCVNWNIMDTSILIINKENARNSHHLIYHFNDSDVDFAVNRYSSGNPDFYWID